MTTSVAFKQRDATRLMKAAIKAGCALETIRLTVLPGGALSLSIQRPADNYDDRDTSWDDA